MSEDVSRGLFSRRRQANVPGGRSHRFVVTVDDESADQLRTMAAVSDVSVPRFLVESALSARAVTITEQRQLGFELTELRRLLATIANNANQVAAYANREGYVPDWAEAVKADYDDVRPTINALVQKLANA